MADYLARTIDEAGRAIGVGRTTLYALISAGKLDARRIGGRTVVLESSLQQFVEALPPVQTKDAT